MRFVRSVLWLLFILALPFIGALACHYLAFAAIQGQFERWHALGQPPEPAVSVVVRWQRVWIVTASKAIYVATRPNDCDSDCWALVIPPIDDPSARFSTPAERCGPWPTFPPAQATGMFCEFGVNTVMAAYALKADGSVWYWSHGQYEWDLLTLFVITALGAVMGLVVSVTLIVSWLIAKWVRRRARQQPAPPPP